MPHFKCASNVVTWLDSNLQETWPRVFWVAGSLECYLQENIYKRSPGKVRRFTQVVDLFSSQTENSVLKILLRLWTSDAFVDHPKERGDFNVFVQQIDWCIARHRSVWIGGYYPLDRCGSMWIHVDVQNIGVQSSFDSRHVCTVIAIDEANRQTNR